MEVNKAKSVTTNWVKLNNELTYTIHFRQNAHFCNFMIYLEFFPTSIRFPKYHHFINFRILWLLMLRMLYFCLGIRFVVQKCNATITAADEINYLTVQ